MPIPANDWANFGSQNSSHKSLDSIKTANKNLLNPANDWANFGSYGRSMHPVSRDTNQDPIANQPFTTLGNQQINPVSKSSPPYGEPTQHSKGESHSAGHARTIAFIGDHRFPPPRPPSTNDRVSEVSSLSFAESYKIAMEMQRPKTEEEASVAFQSISLECFKETDAQVTSCEVKFQKVDTTKVRKIRRREQRLRWAAPAPRKELAMLKPAEQSPSSSQVLPSRSGPESRPVPRRYTGTEGNMGTQYYRTSDGSIRRERAAQGHPWAGGTYPCKQWEPTSDRLQNRLFTSAVGASRGHGGY